MNPPSPADGSSEPVTDIVRQFESIVSLHPERGAFESRKEKATYAQLNQAANRIAHHVLRHLPDDGSPVALCLEQGITLVAALLGVLKAGRLAVLLDPLAASGSTLAILDESGARHVMVPAGDPTPAPFVGPPGVQFVPLPGEGGDVPCRNPGRPLDPEAPAFLIFTTGSTQRPKGVIRPHRSVVWNAGSLARTWGHPDGLRLCFVPAYTTGNGISCLFRALLHGGTIVDFNLRRQGSDDLASWITESAATEWVTSASLFRHLISILPANWSAPALRTIRLGGERVLATDVTEMRRRFGPSCRLVNALSCTEAGTYLGGVLETETLPGDGTVPVGRELDDVQVHLVDENDRIVRPGEVGEIAVHSPGLALGYWRQPELSGRIFRRLDGTAGPDFLRTGDLAKRNPDGTLVCIGRRDRRVRIRGFGIDPDGVEARLASHPAVLEAVVVVTEPLPGQARLTALYRVRPGCAPSAEDLRRHVREGLPEQAVPERCASVDHFPRTPNGKLDLRELRRLAENLPSTSTPSASPRTPAEARVMGIWRDVLGSSGFGPGDHFLEVGGNSLAATRVLARLRRDFQADIPIRDFLDNPTVAWLASQLPPEEASPRPATGIPRLPLRPDHGDGGPLSFAQSRLWFLERLQPGEAAYNVPWAMRLHGPLDREALRRSLAEIVRRHETLRTSFPIVDGEPRQWVHPPPPDVLSEQDLPMIPDVGWEAQLRTFLQAEGWRPFPLESGPIFRFVLIRRAPDDHVLLVMIHHLSTDRWSRWVLTREWITLYDAYRRGQRSPLPELPIQYRDFAAWQRHQISGAGLELLLAYWRRQLAQLPELVLPVDRPRSPDGHATGAEFHTTLPGPLTESVRKFARENGASLYVTLLAAFHVLLHRLSGQSDIVTGTVIANRRHLELESLVGFFANTLVLRGDLSEDPSFGTFLRQLWMTAVGAFQHQDLPFERLVEELNPTRRPGLHPLCQVLFTLQNVPEEALRLAGLRIEPIEVPSPHARFDLAVTLSELPEGRGMRLRFEYNASLFEASTIRHWFALFQATLEAALRQPAVPVSRLPFHLASADSRPSAGRPDNPPAVPYPRDRTLPELFDAQVRQNPEAIALEDDSRSWSYRRLDDASSALAHRLLSAGVAPGDRIAIHLDRSFEFVVAALAILKAGAAYVPLPPDLPADRWSFLLQDCGARILVGPAPPPARPGREIVWISSSENPPPEPSPRRLPAPQPATAPACVLYTSGTTGRPKGVLLPHRTLVRLVHGNDLIPWGPERRILMLASVAFDASTFELWGALLHGATCVILPPGPPAPELLRTWIRRHRIDSLLLTAALLNHVVDEDPSVLTGVRYLLSGGEALSPRHVQKALDALPLLTITNAYGPTECGTIATRHHVERDRHWPSIGSIPIGRPLPNTRVHVVDPALQAVPVGIVGELCIGGDAPALGYLGDTGLTSERFVPDPFSPVPTDRLFRTGDRCRWRPDGSLEFLGRLDGQLKIRGFRIEPGEVEAVLAEHPEVLTATVFPAANGSDASELAAVIVPRASEPDPAGLRAFLSSRLPPAFIPASFGFVQALPLTPNGKLDRSQLARIPLRPAGESAVPSPPRNPVESRLLPLVQRLLQRPQLGIHDDFFASGGHSLMAFRLVSRVSTELRLTLDLADVFRHPTVAGMAAVLRSGNDLPPLPRLQRSAPGTPVFAVPGPTGNLDPAGPNRPR